ncbi:MAG: hypothetical protein IT372_21170 [Polyangiaceae bacterium]|nr:hypothetical protein [Polyangiaceae bacterium]
MDDPQMGQDPLEPAPGPGAPGPAGPAGPPEPAGAPRPARPPSVKASAVILVLALVSSVICVLVVLLVRHYGASRAAAPGAPSATAGAAAESPVVRATVTLRDGNTKAVLRREPAFDAPVVILLPAGTVVEMTKSVTAKGQTWCRVRTQGPPPASGWIHADVLKFD